MNNQSVFKREIISLKSFVKKPVFEKSSKTGSRRLAFFGIILLIDLCLTLMLVGLLSVLEKLGYEEVFESHKLDALLKELPPWIFGLLVIFLGPLIEEVVFRLHLKYRAWVVNILLPLAFSGLIYIVLDSIGQHVNFMIVLAAIVLLYSLFLIKNPNALAAFWDRKFPVIFYITALSFALVHIFNFELSQEIILITPLLVAPQFVLGFLIGYLRVRLGFMWGVALHVSHNAVLVLPLIIGLTMSTDVSEVEIQNEYYQMTVKEIGFFGNEERDSYLSVDSIKLEDYTLKECVGMLLEIDIRHITSTNDFEVLKRLNIFYHNREVSQTVVHTTESNKTAVLSELKTAYGFEVVTVNKEIPHWNLFISDESKFEESYNSIDNNISTYNYEKNSLSVKNGTLNDLVKALNGAYNQELAFSTHNNNHNYPFSIQIDDITFDRLEEFLQNNYGLSFIQEMKNIESTKIIFK
jgi:membrane protease YdiL (CAAX protease family)